MDINQKDHAALRANTCPDCGGPVDIASTGPWCRACDIWFEFVSGWVMRNKAAAQFFALLNAARRDAEKANLDAEKTPRKKEATPVKTAGPRARPQAGDFSTQHTVMSGRYYPHRRELPVSLYRWLLK